MNNEENKIFDIPELKKLKMSNEEKTKWASFVKKIYQQDIDCQKLPNNKCVNDAFIHNILVRDENNEIVIKCRDCHKRLLIKNYLIRQFAVNKLSLSFLKNKDILAINDDEKKINNYFLDSIKKNKPIGLYFYGSVGIGKTFKAIAYCNDMILQNDKTVAYIFMPELIRKMKENFSFDSSFNKKIIDDCCNADILVLDDFGAEYTSAWFYFNMMLIILNHRSEANKTIIIISNFSIDKLSKLLSNSLMSDCKLDSESKQIMVDRIIDRIYYLVQNKKATYDTKTRRH